MRHGVLILLHHLVFEADGVAVPAVGQGSGVYGTLFDTLSLTQCPPPPATGLCIVFPTISFRAADSVGNQSAVGYEFAVDNIAPVADLDVLREAGGVSPLAGWVSGGGSRLRAPGSWASRSSAIAGLE